MGKVGKHALAEVKGQNKEHLTSLLERASDTGLLTHRDATWYGIHPALPWFLGQLFARHYDGQDGCSSAEAALRAWVEAVGALGDYYHDQFIDGNRNVIPFLALEEANLLHARRLARRHGWWSLVVAVMQGLNVLYENQGRGAEWARLVVEIVPDYCTEDDEPVTGREEKYRFVMSYRVELAVEQERDLPQAAAWQEKLAASVRQQAAAALALPGDAPLDGEQRNRIRSLGVALEQLGQILREQGSGDCVVQYEEAIRHYRRIQDTAVEGITQLNLGNAYKDLPDIRDLDAAEAAYQRSLALREQNDALGSSLCFQGIGMVHHERFKEARRQEESQETVLRHAQAAEEHYRKGLNLCPASAIANLGPMHAQLGTFYGEVDQTERAREHYEKAAQHFEKSGDRYNAGKVRFNMALMYAQVAGREETPARRRDLLLRGQAYAQAALRDFQSYQGRAAGDEADARQLLTDIDQDLAKLPQ